VNGGTLLWVDGLNAPTMSDNLHHCMDGTDFDFHNHTDVFFVLIILCDVV
jgi:hypothetical protein